jgi:hypothetical protein
MRQNEITELIEAILDEQPAILVVPLMRLLKGIKGITPKTIPQQLVDSVMALSDEQVNGILEQQRQVYEFLLWTPEAGELPSLGKRSLPDQNGADTTTRL